MFKTQWEYLRRFCYKVKRVPLRRKKKCEQGTDLIFIYFITVISLDKESSAANLILIYANSINNILTMH